MPKKCSAVFRIVRLLFVGAVIGILCGVLGALFHHCIDIMGELRGRFPWLLYLLPLGALLITGIYRVSGIRTGVNDVLFVARERGRLRFLTVPVIFISTLLTQLVGGSAGKEGAALQMGGTLGYHTARLFRLREEDTRIAVTCGLAAFFSAVFGTPFTAALFALEVVSEGYLCYDTLVPALGASFTAFFLSLRMGTKPLFYAVSFPGFSARSFGDTLLLAAACALTAVLFCTALKYAFRGSAVLLKNAYLRAAAGGLLLIAITLLSGTTDYNGAGLGLIDKAIGGETAPGAFLLKILFTAVTLAAGFKGGEIVPTMAVGATLGCAFAALLGADSAFFAAVGIVATFSAMVKCPLTSVILGVELFGSEGLLYYASACAVSALLSNGFCLYDISQIRCPRKNVPSES